MKISETSGRVIETGAKTIGLCMIVKNETSLIRRCLESTLPLVDYILVVDTGSTDGTHPRLPRGVSVVRDFETGGILI